MAENIAQDKRIGWISGNESTPVGIKCYRAHNIDINWHEIAVSDFGADIGGYLPVVPRPAGRLATATFSTELMGSDDADTPTVLGALLRACGLREVRTADGDKGKYKYELEDNATYMNYDKVDLALSVNEVGTYIYHCIGNAVINFPAADIPSVDWEFLGLVDSTHPTPEDEVSPSHFQAHAKPVIVQNHSLDITPEASSVIENSIVRNCTINLGNDLRSRPDANASNYGYNEPQIVRRLPTVALTFEVVDFSVADFHNLFLDEERIAVQFIHEQGGDDGHELTVKFEGKISSQPIFSDADGIFTWDIVIQLVTTGTDILELEWKSI